MKKNQEAFFALLRAGLWEKDIQLLPFSELNFSAIQVLAEEQSVVGLVAAGLEHVTDTKIPKQDLLQFIGQTLQVEEQNKAMNYFIGIIVERMRNAGIYTTLVKGQGIAQCYERPLWRSCGDVDFFLDYDNYQKAKNFLIPLAVHVDPEDLYKLHQAMTIEPWVVELHGTMNSVISNKINKVLDEVQVDVFKGGGTRKWNNDGVDIFLPEPNDDAVIVFAHFINHFYGEGVGLRQICDWCRLLWTYRYSLNHDILESRIRKAGLMTEWKAFAMFAVKFLGMPAKEMPFFSEDGRWNSKASRICKLIIETGNFGHNKDDSYRAKFSKWTGYFITFWRRLVEFMRLVTIFPGNAPKFFITYVLGRVKAVV